MYPPRHSHRSKLLAVLKPAERSTPQEGDLSLSERKTSPLPTLGTAMSNCIGIKSGNQAPRVDQRACVSNKGQASRAISTTRLKRLLALHLWPINPVVYGGPSDPSKGMGDLILGWVSHLDAFSAYPDRTWLPGNALGRTAGKPEVRPSRSSRTRDRSPQISYAHRG